MKQPKAPVPPRTQEGFTIVETLIVLAIAGLILLLVMFAIPALQRNSRNSQRAQDVQAILGAVSQWELNHSGNIPGSSDNYLQAGKTKIHYYDSANIKVQGGSSGWTPAPNPATSVDPDTSIEKVYVYNYQKCDTAAPGKSTAKGAGYSDIVALYAIETSDSQAPKCHQL